jgi:superfamily II DNA or RNA helicase
MEKNQTGNLKLYNHQKNLIEKNPQYHLLAWECGTGKTLTAIKLAETNAKRVLVVCPKSLKENWSRELAKWSTKPEVVWKVVTKEEFRRDWELLASEMYYGLIIDEAHFFAGFKSKMFKNAVKYLKKSKPDCVYLLTATPYMSTPFNIMCLEKLVGENPNYMHYKMNYFDMIPMGSKRIPKIRDDAKYDLAKVVAHIGSTVSKKICMDLPDQVYLREDFELNTEQKRVIKELELSPLVSAHIVYWTKRHQISGGTLKVPDTGDTITFKSDKLKRLKEIADQYKKFVVVCRYNAELEMIASEIGKPFVIFNGATKDRQTVIDQANAAEEMMFLVNASCSEGYNLTGFDLMIFYSNGFSFKDRVQMEGRIHRIGQTNKCTYLDLVMSDNVDEDVVTALKNKQDFNIEIYGLQRG